MNQSEERSEELRKFLQRKTAEEVIKRYLATQKIKSDKIGELYRMKISNCEKLYKALDSKLRAECKAEIKNDIEEGKLDLDTYLTKLKIINEEGKER